MALRIGTRGSALALAQAGLVADLLGVETEIVPITTSGDRAVGGDKERWVKEIEQALLSREIDMAVHSAKDVPGELPDGLELAGAPARADARDALCGTDSLQALKAGARVGTSSLRREAQLRALREDIEVVPLRGNVDTRLRRLADGDFDALVLAAAGLERLDRAEEAGALLDPALMVPAPGQGVIALEIRGDDDAARGAVEAITDQRTFTCLAAERAVVRALDASCRTPVGAYAKWTGGDELELVAFAGLADGSAWVRDVLRGPAEDPEGLGNAVADRLLSAGAADILRQAEEAAA
jgi:hydroxymethylbilane synthase